MSIWMTAGPSLGTKMEPSSLIQSNFQTGLRYRCHGFSSIVTLTFLTGSGRLCAFFGTEIRHLHRPVSGEMGERGRERERKERRKREKERSDLMSDVHDGDEGRGWASMCGCVHINDIFGINDIHDIFDVNDVFDIFDINYFYVQR